ncbi:MAG: ECF transporter S component [Pseudobutyrivibrio sp.]|uniref:ECF transporter S component n=1 Tax=Pseudobutyrivibrio sp. TaxID=2014367 RepID=UPI0025F85223|nr:ECF transporter S component [Pseudobutyrivibrio sp.]MBE5904904.1 ECF transporter S component [Pseudobutyrivibrio sp.]
MRTSKISQKDIAITGMMIALVFLGTFYFKIPTAFGYTHLGDCMIILATCLLGTKKGAVAGAFGAGLADLVGGYTAWVLPTMAFKAAWVLVMGLVAFKLLKRFRYNLWVGAIAGGLIHIALYTLIKIPMFGVSYAFATLLTLSLQTLSGIVLGNIIFGMVKNKVSSLIADY